MIEEIVAVMRTVGDRAEGHRLRALIMLLWRAGLRISEALGSSGKRSRQRPRRRARSSRQGWQATRGWDGPLGVGAAQSMARDSP
jgi:hypothetical protein